MRGSLTGEEVWVHIVTLAQDPTSWAIALPYPCPVCPVPNFLPSVPLSPLSVSSMMPNVINKFLDSTLHKVLPGLVSAQSTPLPLTRRST